VADSVPVLTSYSLLCHIYYPLLYAITLNIPNAIAHRHHPHFSLAFGQPCGIAELPERLLLDITRRWAAFFTSAVRPSAASLFALRDKPSANALPDPPVANRADAGTALAARWRHGKFCHPQHALPAFCQRCLLRGGGGAADAV